MSTFSYSDALTAALDRDPAAAANDAFWIADLLDRRMRAGRLLQDVIGADKLAELTHDAEMGRKLADVLKARADREVRS